MAKKKTKKKKKKQTPEVAAEALDLPEPVGWKFFCIAFAVLSPPCIYAGWVISVSDKKASILPPILGFSAAAFFAGVLAVIVNSLKEKQAQRILKNRNQ